ncbi:cytochrome b5-like heme/steroid binding domain-containing protein [Ilyonectria destructans]|nr:cytochrome b5-like heme/steroid binding domain-containing protein [Ilyonectria destructans]
MSKDKVLSAEEIKKHWGKGDIWIALHGNVYDVSDFMEDHPGGADALLEQVGVDATSAFEDVGHSSDARTLLEDLKIGRADKMVGFHVSFACLYGFLSIIDTISLTSRKNQMASGSMTAIKAGTHDWAMPEKSLSSQPDLSAPMHAVPLFCSIFFFEILRPKKRD